MSARRHDDGANGTDVDENGPHKDGDGEEDEGTYKDDNSSGDNVTEEEKERL
jgi:hypothetical protein